MVCGTALSAALYADSNAKSGKPPSRSGSFFRVDIIVTPVKAEVQGLEAKNRISAFEGMTYVAAFSHVLT